MSRISPFRGLLFDESVVGPVAGVTAPPYDTVGERAHRELERSSPHNVVRIDLGETQSEGDVARDRYTRAADLLEAWRTSGVLLATPEPSWFVYEMAPGPDRQPRNSIRGVIAEVEVEPWGGSIAPHERTTPGPVEDRLRLLRALRANLSPVYAVFPGPRPELARSLETVTSAPARLTATDEEGVRHRLWVVEGALPGVPQEDPLMIADGHHRYTTALRYREEMRATDGEGPWDRTMMLLVDAATERPPVLPFHRIVRGVMPSGGERVRGLEELLARLDDEHGTFGVLGPAAAGTPGEPDRRLRSVSGPPPTVRAVHEEILRETDVVRYTPDAAEAEAAVRTGEAGGAVLLPATSAERIAAVVDAGGRLPLKSTFFWPKPRTGMVLRPLEPW